jgi:hypothetical protein
MKWTPAEGRSVLIRMACCRDYSAGHLSEVDGRLSRYRPNPSATRSKATVQFPPSSVRAVITGNRTAPPDARIA